MLSWNCQGSKKSVKLNYIKEMIEKFKLNLVFIMETKTNTIVNNHRTSNISLPNKHIIPSQNLKGVIWLLWDDNIKIEIIENLKFHIYIKITKNIDDSSHFITLIHASPRQEKRVPFQKHLVSIQRENFPFCIIGDFEYCESWEK